MLSVWLKEGMIPAGASLGACELCDRTGAQNMKYILCIVIYDALILLISAQSIANRDSNCTQKSHIVFPIVDRLVPSLPHGSELIRSPTPLLSPVMY